VNGNGPAADSYRFIKVGVVGEAKNVGLISLNRPVELNVLSSALMNEVCFIQLKQLMVFS
jgi:hypothetical protein